MASEAKIVELPLPPIEEKAQPVSSLRFDWVMIVVSIWWLGGIFIDGWAHSNIPQLETFFTPWHAVLYSGYLAVAITLLVKIAQNLQQAAATAGGVSPSLVATIKSSLPGNRWLRAIPVGYELALLGVGIFLISGIGDLTWHLAFGIEQSIDALLSPTHLGLALGSGLALSAPLRAAWQRRGDAPSWRQLGPAIFSLTATLSLLTFFTSYAAALLRPYPLSISSSGRVNGVIDILLSTGLLMSFVLLALRRWRLPMGTFPFLFTINAGLMCAFSPLIGVLLLPTALLGGVAADLVYKRLQPSEKQPASIRLFAFVVPLILYAFYFLNLIIIGPILAHARPLAYASGITWTVHFWAGSIVMAGITGFLLSYVMLPPAKPAEKLDEPVA
jgi:hypothetical protein